MASHADKANAPAGPRLPYLRDIVAVVGGVMAAAALFVGGIQYVTAGVDIRMQAMEDRLRGDIAVVRGEVAEVRRDVARIDARLVRVETIVSEIRNRSESGSS